jgi:hypothetical protein
LQRRGEEDRVKLTNYGFLVKKKIHQKNHEEKRTFRRAKRANGKISPGLAEILVEPGDLCYRVNM